MLVNIMYAYMYMYVYKSYLCVFFPRCLGWGWAGLALLLAVFSVLSKEQGITVVAVCFTIDVFLMQKVYIHVYTCICMHCTCV